MVKSLDPPILIFPELPKGRLLKRPRVLSRWRARSNWPEYCLLVTVLVCLPVNLTWWSQTSSAKAAPKVVFGRLASLSQNIVTATTGPKMAMTPDAAMKGVVAPVQVAASAQPKAAILPPAIGPTGKGNPPAPVVAVMPGTIRNSYAYGHCTWYVAGRRSLPSRWGNARNWYSNAQAAGYKVGSAPAVNAIAWTSAGWFGHVAYVEEVDGNRVLIAEMNNYAVKGGGWNRVSRRWVNASEFKYIY